MWALLSTILGLFDKIFGYVSSVETTKIQAQAQVETAAIQGMSAVEVKWPFVAMLLVLFALPVGIYDAKAILWDNVIMNGTTATPALKGSLANLNWIIPTGLFLHMWNNK